jgi:O-antigen/teichoic acid export membrane protein
MVLGMNNMRNKAYQLLRKSESIFKLDMIYIAKGGLWTTLSFSTGLIGSLATMVAFGNLLPRETYGIYTYLISLGGSLAFLTLTGTGPAVTRAVARGIESVVPEALRLQLRYNLLAIATVTAAASYYLFKGNVTFSVALFLLAIAYPVAETFHLYANILTGRKRFDLLAKVTTLITLTGALTMVVTLLLTDNVLTIIGVFAFMSLVPKIFVYRWVTRNLKKQEPNPEDLREMRRTAFHITGAGIIGTIASYIDKIILFQIAGPISLAIYGFAIAGPERLKSLVKNWLSIALPRLTESTLREIRRVFYKRVFLSVLIGAVLAGLYVFLAPQLFRWFLPKYSDSVLYSQIYSLVLLVTPPAIYIANIFSAQNMLRAIYAQNLGNHLVRIVLFVMGAWLWQIWGLIAASIISSVINSIYGIILWEIEYRRLMKKNEQA